MARLTPAELHDARRASGRLGGRPRKPTAEEARVAALEELVPKALRVLRDELDQGGPNAVRAALKLLDHAWGRPTEHVTLGVPEEGEVDLRELSDHELEQLKQRLRAQIGVQEQRQLPAAS